MGMRFFPMPLATVREPFCHPDWLFEPKYDGFRALAYIDGHRCQLVSRRGNVFKSWPYLCEELAHAVRCTSAVLDGEIACSHFYNLMFRRDWPYFMAFDLLSLDGTDLRDRPLQERERLLARIMPRVDSRIRVVEGIPGCGVDFFRVACARPRGHRCEVERRHVSTGPAHLVGQDPQPALLAVGRLARPIRRAQRQRNASSSADETQGRDHLINVHHLQRPPSEFSDGHVWPDALGSFVRDISVDAATSRLP